MTSSFRRRKKSVRQKTEQRLKAKEVLSATGYLKNYNLEAFDEMSTSRCKMENLVATGEKSCSEYLGQLKQCSNRSLCFIIGLVLMSMLIYEKCEFLYNSCVLFHIKEYLLIKMKQVVVSLII